VIEEQGAKERVRAQYGAAGDAYVRSPGHAGGDDLRRMIEAAQAQPGDRALDIATGGGHVAKGLAPLVAEVVASDLTPQMLVTAERFITGEGFTNVRFQQADAEDLPFADASFDIVTCRIAPHHFPNPERFVSESARVLRPGGRFLLIDSTVPAGEIGVRYNRFELVRDPSHVRSLTTDEWTALIEQSGLTLESVEHFTKRHIFRDWAARARVPDDQMRQLASLLLDGGPEMAKAFRVERDGDELIAFTDEKTLFVARKPAG
jgi:ubiquinone/menaquinone biosynthesis C-methylase UbiE